MLQQVTLFFESFDTKSILEMSWTSDSHTQQTQPHTANYTQEALETVRLRKYAIYIFHFSRCAGESENTTLVKGQHLKGSLCQQFNERIIDTFTTCA